MQHHYNVDITELKCDICNSVLRTKRKLKLHKQIHGEAKYACDICGKLFHVKHYVNEHKLTHKSQTEDCQVTAEKNEI
jgi:transposase-like protein